MLDVCNGLPSGSGLLPARPPLRTVLESFPSYGSSPTKISPVRRNRSRFSGGLTILECGRFGLRSFEATVPRTHQPTGVDRHLLFSFEAVPHTFLPCQTRPTWAYPAHYTLAFAFSVISRLLLLTRLAVRSAGHLIGRGWQLFHVLRPSP